MFKNKICKKLFLAFFVMLFVLYANEGYSYLKASESNVISMEEMDYRDYITGTGTYFNWTRAFYNDGNGNIAYCTQSDMTPKINDPDAYVINDGIINKNDEIHKAITTILCNGYPVMYGKYAVDGRKGEAEYISGLIVGGKVYECTPEEARAATAFAIHRKMLDYVEDYKDIVRGNEATILTYKNGKLAVHDVVAIQDAIYNSTKYNHSITTTWQRLNEDGSFTAVKKPAPICEDGANFDYYIKVKSKNCYVSSVKAISGDSFVNGKIKNVIYENAFEKIVCYSVPKKICQEDKIGITCSTSFSECEKATTLGNTKYQDFIIIPESETLNFNFEGEYPKGKIKITKKDESTKMPLADAKYGIYSDEKCKNIIGEITTNKGGIGSFEGLKPGKYYVREISAPNGYMIDKKIYTVTVMPDDEASMDMLDKPFYVSFVLKKVDSETKTFKPQGDASLIGASYGLYAKEDIRRSPAGELLAKKDELVKVLTIDVSGSAEANWLTPGKYYLKEKNAPNGYILDEKIYDIDLSNVSGEKDIVEIEKTVNEDVVKQAFRLKKFNQTKDGKKIPLKNAGFSAWRLSELTRDENGQYNFEAVKPVALNEDGSTELITDDEGSACSIKLPYGKYIVRETTVPFGYKPIDDFVVNIVENSNDPQPWLMLNDEAVNTKLKIVKKDSETNRPILKPGFGFKIFDIDNECYISAITEPTAAEDTDEMDINAIGSNGIEDFKQDIFYTNEEGFIVVPVALNNGRYRLEEVFVPENSGYSLNEKPVEIEIKNGFVVLENADEIIKEVEFFNDAIKGKLTLIKRLELKGVTPDGVAGEKNKLDEVKFELYAAEDIVKPDGYNKKRDFIYRKNQLIDTISIDISKGNSAEYKDLPIGKYYLKEVKTLPGYIYSDEPVFFDIKPDKENKECSAVVTVDNKLTETKIYKKDKDTDKLLKGAVLLLYDDKGNLIEKWESGEEYKPIYGLVLGHTYILREESAPEGYKICDDVEFVFTENMQEVTIYNKKKVILGDKEKPHTGDSFNPLIYGVLVLSILGIIAIIFVGRSQEDR